MACVLLWNPAALELSIAVMFNVLLLTSQQRLSKSRSAPNLSVFSKLFQFA